eukprot:m.339307 g.339307  ORF g.339307 m.339307 type:complete len:88 (+) comp20581_c0_seq5:403-666(+)
MDSVNNLSSAKSSTVASAQDDSESLRHGSVDVVALQNLCEAQKLEVMEARKELSEMKSHMKKMTNEFGAQMLALQALLTEFQNGKSS